jgi:hypothetical protein
MSTRTSIRIGTLVDTAMKQRLPEFKRVLEEYTNQYFLFCYRKPALGHYYVTVLFQASKTFGGVTCEVGVSRTEDYPYYRYFDRPQLGVHGFRARTRHLLKGLDSNTTKTYTGPDTLTAALMELVAEASSASNKLLEMAVPRIAQEYALWQPIYTEWQEAERAASPNPDRRYPELVGETVARRILHSVLASGRYDGFMGPRKFRYREPDFLNCHVYLLARALAFVDPPEADEVDRFELDPGQDPEKIIFDAIASLCGRSEQDDAVELPDQILSRAPHWAFLRSFAALEAFFENPVISLDEVRSSVKEPLPVRSTASASTVGAPAGAAPAASGPSLSLDELYGDTPLPETSLGPAELPPLEPLEQPQTETRGQQRPDPFELIEPYLTGEAPQASAGPAADPFELLGAQFGL